MGSAARVGTATCIWPICCGFLLLTAFDRLLRVWRGSRGKYHSHLIAWIRDYKPVFMRPTSLRPPARNSKAMRQPLPQRRQRLARLPIRNWRNCGRLASVSRNSQRTQTNLNLLSLAISLLALTIAPCLGDLLTSMTQSFVLTLKRPWPPSTVCVSA